VIADPELSGEVIASGPITYGLLAVPLPVAHPHVVKPAFPLIVMPPAA
jgi:hypothetical protein